MAKPRAFTTQFPYDNYPDADFLTHPEKPLDDRPFMLIREGLLLNEETYRTLRDHAAPMGRGAGPLDVSVRIEAACASRTDRSGQGLRGRNAHHLLAAQRSTN